MDTSFFDSNWARFNGGIICAGNSTLKGYNNTFTNNSSGDDGGVMLAFDNSDLSMKDSEFANNNVAIGKGGVFFAQESTILVFNCNFHSSKAEKVVESSTHNIIVILVSTKVILLIMAPEVKEEFYIFLIATLRFV